MYMCVYRSVNASKPQAFLCTSRVPVVHLGVFQPVFDRQATSAETVALALQELIEDFACTPFDYICWYQGLHSLPRLVGKPKALLGIWSFMQDRRSQVCCKWVLGCSSDSCSSVLSPDVKEQTRMSIQKQTSHSVRMQTQTSKQDRRNHMISKEILRKKKTN